MVVFFDTSSLLKRYIEEKGSREVDPYFIRENSIWISPVTTLEVNAALKRKIADGSIDYNTYNKAVEYWEQDYRNYLVVPYNEKLIVSALDIIKSHGIKTLDAIQLGSALLSEADISITSDEKMHNTLQTLIKGKTVFI